MHHLRTAQPFFSHGNHNEFLRHKSQSEQGRKSNETGETKHLAEGTLQTLLVVTHLHKHRLRHALHHASDELTAHLVPFVCLVVGAHHLLGVEITKNECEKFVVDAIKDVCYQQLAGKSKHLSNGLETKMARRTETRVFPTENGNNRHIHHCLRHNAPITHATYCHRYAHNARNQQGNHSNNRLFLHPQLLEQDGPGSDGETGKEEAQEGIAGQPKEFGVAKELDNERRTKPQNHIEEGTHGNVKPKDGIIIHVGGVLSVGQRRNKTAFLQRSCNGRKDGEFARQSIVFLRQNSRQNDTEDHIEQLRGTIVCHAPKQPFCCFFLQRGCCFIAM